MISGRPTTPIPVPAAVTAAVAGAPVTLAWRNEVGGLTYEFGSEPDRRFIKWTPAGSGIELGAEIDRLRWAIRFTAVPEVLEQGADEDGAWFISCARPGLTAVHDRWKSEPAVAVAAIGTGLRALHENLPVSTCPFTWSVEDRIADAGRRALAGRINPARWHESHQPLGLQRALDLLADPPPTDRLVVCHGDACAPNTLVGENGRCTAHVDFGAMGVADRWADLAIATWSTQWNFGADWEDHLLAAYGIAPDPERTAYYRLLWDLGP